MTTGCVTRKVVLFRLTDDVAVSELTATTVSDLGATMLANNTTITKLNLGRTCMSVRMLELLSIVPLLWLIDGVAVSC